jgi:cation diffusion facilitator family transporter
MMIAIRPADISHPQGHRRFEPLVGLLISFSMAWAGYQAISESIDKIRSGPTTFDLGLPILVLFFSAVIKGVMYWLIHRIAIDLSSPTLKTAATDNLMDTITSFTAIIGIYLSSIWSPLADPIAGILVSVWIFRAAFEALQENLGFLTGAGASEERRQQFLDIIRSVPGVANVHQLFAEHVGSTFVLDVHINVDGNTPLYQVHRIETEIEEKLTAIPDVERAYIHVEPLGYE